MNGFDSYRVRERADIAQLVLVAAFLLLVGAFFRTQIIQHEKFQLRAETNRLRPIPLTPPRGTIFDRNGRRHRRERARATRSRCWRRRWTRSGPCSPGSAASCRSTPPRSRRSSAASAQARYQPAVVFGDATFETIARLEEHRAVLPGLVIQSEPKRLYPAGKAVAHLVGYVSEVTETDLTADRYPGRRARHDRGQGRPRAGVRRHPARAAKGVRYIEVNARGRLVREDAGGASLPPTPGRADHHHDRPRPPALHRQHLARGRPRRDDRDDAGRRRSAPSTRRPTYDPNVVRGRHLPGQLAGAQRGRGPPAAQPRDPDPLSARLAVQAGHRRHGAEARAHRPRHPHAHALPRRAAAGQPGVPLLEEGRARLARPGRRRGRELRRVLLPGRASARASTRSSRTAC